MLAMALGAGAVGVRARRASIRWRSALLFCAGFFELSFSSMAQTMVQMNAPDAIRGRVLGLFNMASAGLRSLQRRHRRPRRQRVSIHTSLAVSAAFFALGMGALFLRRGRLR